MHLYIDLIESLDQRNDIDNRDEIMIVISDLNSDYLAKAGVCYFDDKENNKKCRFDIFIPFNESMKLIVRLKEMDLEDIDEGTSQPITMEDIKKGYIEIEIKSKKKEYTIS